MLVNVELLAFNDEPGTFRRVEIPNVSDLEGVLNLTFHYGQNDFQPVTGCYSVSVGDVIYYNDKKYRVAPVGFEEMSENEYAEYIKTASMNRHFWHYHG